MWDAILRLKNEQMSKKYIDNFQFKTKNRRRHLRKAFKFITSILKHKEIKN